MRRLRRLTIKRLVTAVTATSIMILLLVQAAFFLEVRRQVYLSQYAAAETTANQLLNSLALRQKQLKQAEELLIMDANLALYLSSQDLPTRYAATKRLDVSMEFISASTPDVRDVALVELDGDYASFFSVLTDRMLGRIRDVRDIAREKDRERHLFYLPSDGSIYEDCYIYSFPVFGRQPGVDFRKKVGTVVFLCRMSGIREEVSALADSPGMDLLLTAENSMVMAAAGTDAIPLNCPLSQPEIPFQIERAVANTGWRVCSNYSTSLFNTENTMYWKYMMVILLVAVVEILLIAVLTGRLLTRPIQRILTQMRGEVLRSGNARVTAPGSYEIEELTRGINDMLTELGDKNQRVVSTLERLYEMEILKNEAEFRSLSSQVNPHFLYNTLECIRGIAMSKDNDVIADMATAMADIFRYSIKGDPIVPVRRELQVIDSYLFITRSRFGERYQISVEADEAILDCTIPKMILQPLVENAMLHGLSDVWENGALCVTGENLGGCIRFRVRDNGIGIPEDRLEAVNGGDSGGIGIANIRKRLRVHMGEEARLTVESSPDGTMVTVIIPKQPPDVEM